MELGEKKTIDLTAELPDDAKPEGNELSLEAFHSGWFECKKCDYDGNNFLTAAMRNKTGVCDVIVCPKCENLIATPQID